MSGLKVTCRLMVRRMRRHVSSKFLVHRKRRKREGDWQNGADVIVQSLQQNTELGDVLWCQAMQVCRHLWTGWHSLNATRHGTSDQCRSSQQIPVSRRSKPTTTHVYVSAECESSSLRWVSAVSLSFLASTPSLYNYSCSCSSKYRQLNTHY